MRHAAMLAERGRGTTAPNPCVGAVLVRDGHVVAEGWHQQFGGPHAEPNCLADARAKGIAPADCTLFVTLEPCNHHGKTPPCSQAVCEAGVKQIYVGTLDPNPKAEGGAQYLRAQGVTVHVGTEEQLCLDLTCDFRTWQFTQRPYVFLKLASTLDGKIATRTGHSKWISCEESRADVHRLRALCQAVIVGGGTLRADNPRLNVRRPETGVEPGADPLAVVVTTNLPDAGQDLFLLRERPQQTVFWTSQQAADSDRAQALAALGCRVWGLPAAAQGGLELERGLIRLRTECGAWYVLCEGGGQLALRFIEAGLMDEFRLYVAPRIVGDDQAKGLFAGRAPQTMDQALDLRVTDSRPSGVDTLLTYRPKDKDA
ncbi:MAG: bifunctional diaminohydroxyphosphoribosylaminopyrimidine deaminase/5-amino-6-(5-phosphoribosylamino)uracil reductase RibD [Proteobacteria bacterium]|nr:bifunctional diaminohydroxyphosphoribosylaminopyrimidine deaminase/5-amino-6-(5-phosphoribosylamino)uracil reductase RibD [Pseudomonadota bacterium]